MADLDTPPPDQPPPGPGQSYVANPPVPVDAGGPPPDQGFGPGIQQNLGTMQAPPEFDPFSPFARSPQDLRRWDIGQMRSPTDPEEQRWRQRWQTPVAQTNAPPPGQPHPMQGKPPPPWPPNWVPNRRQFFTPHNEFRPPNMWGTEGPFPNLPPIWQVPNILMGVGQRFAMFGGPLLAMLGLGLNRYVTAFMNGYQRGQGGGGGRNDPLRQQKEQMDLHARQLDEAAQEQLDTYRKIFAEYGDPDTGEVSKENEPKLRQALIDAANSMPGGPDRHMLNAIANQGIPGAMNMIHTLDNTHRDLRSSRKAQEKEQKERDELAPWQNKPSQTPLDAQPDDNVKDWQTPGAPETPGAGPQSPSGAPSTPSDDEGPGLGVSISQAEPSQRQAQAGAQGGAQQGQQQQTGQSQEAMAPDDERQRYPQVASSDPSFMPQPAAAAPAAAPEEEYQPAPSTARAAAENGPLHLNGDKIDSTARRIANGEKIPVTEIPKKVWPYVSARAAEMTGELDRIQQFADTHPNFTGKKALDAIKQANPRFGAALESYVSGAAKIQGGSRNPLFDRIIGLGHVIDHRFSQGTYDLRQTTIKNATTGPMGRMIVSQLTGLDHLTYLKELASKLPHTPVVGPMMNRILQKLEVEGPDFIGQAMDIIRGTPGLSEEDKLNIMAYTREVSLIAPEVIRAQKGAAATQDEEHTFRSNMIGYTPEQTVWKIEHDMHLIQQRLRENYKAFSTGMGGYKAGEYDDLFQRFENRGMPFDTKDPKIGENGGTVLPTHSGRSMTDELKYQLRQPTIPDPSPPGAAPPAPTAAPPAAPAAPPTAQPAAPAAPAAPSQPSAGRAPKTIGGQQYYPRKDGGWDTEPGQ